MGWGGEVGGGGGRVRGGVRRGVRGDVRGDVRGVCVDRTLQQNTSKSFPLALSLLSSFSSLYVSLLRVTVAPSTCPRIALRLSSCSTTRTRSRCASTDRCSYTLEPCSTSDSRSRLRVMSEPSSAFRRTSCVPRKSFSPETSWPHLLWRSVASSAASRSERIRSASLRSASARRSSADALRLSASCEARIDSISRVASARSAWRAESARSPWVSCFSSRESCGGGVGGGRSVGSRG